MVLYRLSSALLSNEGRAAHAWLRGAITRGTTVVPMTEAQERRSLKLGMGDECLALWRFVGFGGFGGFGGSVACSEWLTGGRHSGRSVLERDKRSWSESAVQSIMVEGSRDSEVPSSPCRRAKVPH